MLFAKCAALHPPAVGLFFLGFLVLLAVAWCRVCFRFGTWLVSGPLVCSRRRERLATPAQRNYARAYEPDRPTVPPRVPAAPRVTPGPRPPAPPRFSWLSLVTAFGILALLMSGLRNSPYVQNMQTPPRPKAPTSAPASAEERPVWVVQGIGQTREDAEANALEKAHENVLVYLHQQLPSLQYLPKVDYVRQRLVKDLRNEPDKELPAPVGLARQVSLRVEVTPADLRDVLRLDRQQRMEHRVFWLGKVLGGLVVLLACVSGYVRFAEFSKGYCAGMLKAAVWVMLALGIGLLYFLSRGGV